MFGRAAALIFAVSALSLGSGCAAQAARDDEEASELNGTDDLNIGEVEGAASTWGSATDCKPIPALPALKSPEIVISLDGLTLHLRDRAGSYDKVFPIGPGAIGENGKSMTPTGTFYTGSNTAEVSDAQWGYYYPCRIWWTDTDNGGKKSPVFAGLPFIRLAGPPTAGYGIHGPIDRFTAPNGGSLRRGYVSHGCVRMAAEDIVTVYALIKGRPRTPVRIQREIEHSSTGEAIDVPQRWVGSECNSNDDCNFDGGTCRIPQGATIGTCTRACTRGCPDRVGEVSTFCVNDPAAPTSSTGICVPQSSVTFNDSCDRYAGRIVAKASVARPDKSARANVCMPLR
jgi:hypothetical protein